MKTFFEHQADAQQRTRWLLLGLVVAVFGMGVLLFALLWLLYSMLSSKLEGLAEPDIEFWTRVFWSCVLGTAAVVTLASSWRAFSLRAGGGSVADMLGGRLVSGQPRDALDRRLLNVVEELAIASGAPVPRVFVLDAEPGINALAAGWEFHDAAIAVTRGCLDKLTRAELQGVIGHEFSHILRGDMRLNLRLMGSVFGVLFIALLGRQLLRVADISRRSGAPVAMLGIGLIGIGSLGALCANLLKAAVSRQREYLADASAVQFTRDPAGISTALQKIGGHVKGALIVSPNAEEASHFFFADSAFALRAAGSWLATHPPLIERIQRIDPSFRGVFPKPEAFSSELEADFAAAAAALAPAGRSVPPPAALIARMVGVANTKAIAASHAWLERLPSQLGEAARNPFSASALMYALVLAADASVRAQQLRSVASAAGPEVRRETERLAALVTDVAHVDRLQLAELAAPALHALATAQRAQFTRTLDALIEADSAISLFEYVLADFLRKQARVVAVPQRRRLATVAREAELVVSLLAHAGDLDGSGAATAFGRAAVRLPAISITLLPANARQLSALGPALTELRQLRPTDSAQLVEACSHAVLADQRATDTELTLLRAICLALGAPVPMLG